MATIKVEVLNTKFTNLISKAHDSDAGYDLIAAIDNPLTLDPLSRAVVPTGIKIALPKGYEAQIRSRSGLAAKHGIFILNSPGTIDEGYRGEIGVILTNLSASSYTLMPGDRIAQLVPQKCSPVSLSFVASVDDEGTTRGEAGFGSSGK